MKRLHCEKCGYEWLPRTEDVKECPKCKSRNWKKEEKQNVIITTPVQVESPLAKILADLIGGNSQNDRPL